MDESNEPKQEEDQDDERTGESDEEQKKSGKKGRNVEREEDDEKVTNMESGGNETEEEYDQENSSEDAEDGKEEEEEEEESPEDKEEEEEEGNGSGKGSRFWPFSKDSEDEKRLPSSVPDVEPETCPSVGYCMAVCYEFSPEENRSQKNKFVLDKGDYAHLLTVCRRRRRHMLPFAPEVEEKKEELGEI